VEGRSHAHGDWRITTHSRVRHHPQRHRRRRDHHGRFAQQSMAYTNCCAQCDHGAATSSCRTVGTAGGTCAVEEYAIVGGLAAGAVQFCPASEKGPLSEVAPRWCRMCRSVYAGGRRKPGRDQRTIQQGPHGAQRHLGRGRWYRSATIRAPG